MTRRLSPPFPAELPGNAPSEGGGSSGAAVDVVAGTAPIVITGTASHPDVTITAATDGAAGSMSAADKTILDKMVLSSGNYITVYNPNNSSNQPANTSAAPANYIVAVMVFTPLVSGIFDVKLRIGYHDSVAETVTWGLTAFLPAAAGPITVTGGQTGGVFGPTAPVSPATSAETSAVAGTQITLGNVGGGTVVDTYAIPTIAGLETIQAQQYSFTAIADNGATAGGPASPFPLNLPAAYALRVSAPAGVISGMALDWSVSERFS